MEFKHKSVLLEETIDGLRVKPDGIYVDGTLGGAGHASEVCKKFSAKGRFIGIDQDQDAIIAASERLDAYKDPEFGNAHDRIELQTLHGAEYYRVVAAFAVPVYTGNDFLFYGFIKAENRKEYDTFIRECKERSLYELTKTAVYRQRLLTLSTCEYSHQNGRMVVVAVQEE